MTTTAKLRINKNIQKSKLSISSKFRRTLLTKQIFDYETTTTESKINIEDPLPTLKDTKVSQ
jgi:hypothetical protein